MNRFIITTILVVSLFSIDRINAQQVIAAGGGEAKSSTFTVAYTVGEIATLTLSGSTFIVNQGFQQPSYVVTSIEDNLLTMDLKIFPNPTTGILHAEIAQSTEVMLQVRLYDIKGQLILEKEESLFDRQAIFDLDLSNLTPGIFILKIFSKDKPLKVMQILKN
jgi:hypothetical protein